MQEKDEGMDHNYANNKQAIKLFVHTSYMPKRKKYALYGGQMLLFTPIVWSNLIQINQIGS